jgi:hypothetical protein
VNRPEPCLLFAAGNLPEIRERQDAKFNRRCDRFQRRGRSTVRSEWRLIAATHNLLELWRHTTAPLPA